MTAHTVFVIHIVFLDSLPCGKCGQIYLLPLLRYHEATCGNIQDIACPEENCPYMCSKAVNLKRHMIMKHKKVYKP